jgi:sporulation protein YunB
VRRFRRGWIGFIRRRGRPGLPRPLRWVILLGACLYLGFRITDAVMAGPLEAAAENQARALAIEAVNRVVLERVAATQAENLVTYRFDGEGRVTALQVDTMAINRIASGAAEAVEAELARLDGTRLGIPAGALTGMRLLAHLGPPLSVRITPVGNVLVSIRQRFEEAGINQTRHLVYLEATARIRLVVPFVSREAEVSTELPLSETVLVGPVPQALYKGNLGGVTVPGR